MCTEQQLNANDLMHSRHCCTRDSVDRMHIEWELNS